MRLFDDLLIVLSTPRHLLVYMHDWVHGVASAGVKTVSTGHAIQLRGPKYESSWEKALDSIVAKLGASKCRRISVMPLNHKDVLAELNATAMSQTSSLISRAYNEVPFATLSPFGRAAHFRKLAYTVDTLLHPGSHFDEAVVDARINGSRRSPQQATYSWSRSGQRVACKHSQLSWNTSHEWWKCHFAHVKFADGQRRLAAGFDELILVITLKEVYTSTGTTWSSEQHLVETRLRRADTASR